MPRITKLIPKPVREGIRAAVRDVIFFGVLPVTYRVARLRSVDQNLALFVEETKTEPSDNFTLLLQRLPSSGLTCDFYSLKHYSVGTIPYYGRCMAMVWRAARAHYVFLCEASAPISCLRLRPETKVTQLWHACGAFKKFGMSTADKLFGDSAEEKRRHPYYENLSLVTVSSPEVCWAYVEAMDLGKTPDVVQATGVSRTDVYFDEAYLASQRQLVLDAVPQAQDKKVLLYAPTFRGHIAEAKAPDALDMRLLKEHLGDEYVLLIKHHPFVKRRPAIPQGCESFAFDVSDQLSIEAAMAAADVCVSDYSSLVFEYSLLNRPVAFFAYDRADYDDWRGFYYDYDEMTPGPIFTTTEELADWIEHLDERFDPAEVAAFREKFMGACDGHATERIVDRVLSNSFK